jgi:hypothetical protein
MRGGPRERIRERLLRRGPVGLEMHPSDAITKDGKFASSHAVT